MAAPIGLLAELRKEVDVPEAIIVNDDITIQMPTREQMIQFQVATTADERLRALYGSQYDAVVALFAKEPVHLWSAFNDRVFTIIFGKGADDVEGK